MLSSLLETFVPQDSLSDVRSNNSVMYEIISQVTEIYRNMSLLELLAEENISTKIWHGRRLDPARKRLQEILRSEIEKKLR